MLYPLSYGGSACAESVHDRAPRLPAGWNPLQARAARVDTLGPVTPHELSDAVVHALSALVEPRRRRSSTAACPSRSSWSVHGTARTATTPPTSRSSSPSGATCRRGRSPALLAAGADRRRGHRVGRRGRAGLPQHHLRRRRPGRAGRADRRRRARRTGATTTLAGRRGQRRVHLGQPDRTRCTSGTPAGRRSATPSRGSWRRPARRSPASSTSTTAATRWTSSVPRSRRRARAGRSPRTATTATTSPTWPSRSWRRAPASWSCPEGSGWSRSARRATSCQLAEQREQLGDVPDALRRVVLRAQPLRRGQGRARARRAREAGPPLRGRRRAVDAHHRLRRRQGPRAAAGQRRAHVLRLRHRLLRRQARARLRRLHLPAGRRPPRLRRAAPGDGGVRRRRPEPDPRGADRAAGEDPARRRGGPAVASGRGRW